MNHVTTQEDLNSVLLNTIRQFVVDELVTKKDQKIDFLTRITDSGTMIIDITNRQKHKKVILVYQADQLITTPKARRRINEGTKYIPSYIEINSNVRQYTFGITEYKNSIENGFANSILKTITQQLVRELLNDTGYPIDPDERISAVAGNISDTENDFLKDHRYDPVAPGTKYFRVVSVSTDNCFTKEDRPDIVISDNVNYSNFLAGRSYCSYKLTDDDAPAPKVGNINVGDYMVVYYATNNDARAETNRKVVRFVKPQTFTHWFK